MASDRPVWWVALLIVVIGGAAGVAARAAAVLPFPADSHPLVVPAVTMGVNIVGSFLLGLLLGVLGDRRPGLRLLVGTGFLGGFTTYSAFAVHSLQVFTDAPVVGLVLIAASLFGGVIAAGVGLVVGSGRRADAA
ncbi:CrcB family protein [Microbacterium marinum]|uniref:fluoride efflux transporter FluC n=1 Tax=Microbacterium marinum TaxID=421115 RepID=UPI00384A662B